MSDYLYSAFPDLEKAYKAGLAANASDERALAYARTLATALHRNHYATTAPQWKPFDDLYGILTQIDNMICGLTANAQAPVALTDEQIEVLKWCMHFHARRIDEGDWHYRIATTVNTLLAAPIASALPAKDKEPS